MHLTTAVLVDDCPDQLRMLARVLQRAGWIAHTAEGSSEGEALAARILAGPAAGIPTLRRAQGMPEGGAHTVILTDMHMPGDPYAAAHPWGAGAYLALRLRARMVWGQLPRVPIVGITSLLEPEQRQAALLCGCDAVLEKDPPLSLAARIHAALEQSYFPDRPSDLDALLRLAQPAAPPAQPRLTDADITAALLAYRRYGVIGLGESALARALVPQAVSVLGRGEAAAILRMELECGATPRQRALERALSRAQYYRHRQRAVRQLRDLLAHDQPYAAI